MKIIVRFCSVTSWAIKRGEKLVIKKSKNSEIITFESLSSIMHLADAFLNLYSDT